MNSIAMKTPIDGAAKNAAVHVVRSAALAAARLADDLYRNARRRAAEREAIRHLHEVSDSFLKDIGIDRYDIEAAVRGTPMKTERVHAGD